jgi:hypothetical protein
VLLSAERAVLLLVDFQQRLMPAIHDGDTVVARAVRLAEAATLLDVPVLATEQYPAGLGPTVEPLAGYPKSVLAKTSFSAAADPGFAALLPAGTREVVNRGRHLGDGAVRVATRREAPPVPRGAAPAALSRAPWTRAGIAGQNHLLGISPPPVRARSRRRY